MPRRGLVGIVILNYNNSQDTIACMDSLAPSTYDNYHIIVVDNGSVDESPRRIQEAFPETELLINDQNLGFSAGANIGIERAFDLGASYVWLLNNDTIAASECLDYLVTAAENESKVGIIVPKIYYYNDPTRIWSAGARWEAFPPRVKMIGFGQRNGPVYNRRCDLDYATGCALLIPRHTFEVVGAFDPIYFMYQEDYDFCRRVRETGLRIVYVPRAHVWHKVSQGLGEGSPEKWYLWSKSAAIFYKKFFSIPTLICFLGWVFLRELSKGNLSFLQPFARGARDGVRVRTI
jgi:GT2 family glycosyltransferase